MKLTLVAWVMMGAIGVIGVMVGYRAGWDSAREVEVARNQAPEARALPSGLKRRPEAGSASLAKRVREAVAKNDEKARRKLEQELGDLRAQDLWELLAGLEDVNSSPARQEMLEAVLRRLAELDPSAAMAEAERLLPDFHLTVVWGHILASWARVHPEAALAKARELSEANGASPAVLISSVVAGWADYDFEGAVAMVGGLVVAEEREVAVKELARRVVADETLRERIMEIAATLGELGLRSEFLAKVVTARGRTESLEEVEEWIDAQEFEGELRASMLQSLARGAGSRNPRRTAEWLMSHSTSASRADDLEAAVVNWVNSAPEACGKWLLERSQGPDADRALDTYSAALALDDPAAALRWANRIHDEELRQQRFERIVRFMEPGPRGHLEKILAESGLSEEDMQQILGKVGGE